MPSPHPDQEPEKGQFPETKWTLVLEAKDDDDETRARALQFICETYWYPIYCFVRRRGLSPPDAEDATQGFFGELLSKERFRLFSEEKGKLRAYLLTSIKHYLRDCWVASRAEKRGGGKIVLSLDVSDAEERYTIEPVDFDTPERLFELRWALTILERAMERTKQAYLQQGKEHLFQRFRNHLAGDGDLSFREIGEELDVSESTARVMLFRLRKLYRSNIEEEVQATIGEEESMEDELKYINRIFST